MRKARIYDARQLPAYLSPAQYAELMSIDKKDGAEDVPQRAFACRKGGTAAVAH